MQRNLLSVKDLTKKDILTIFKQADEFREQPKRTQDIDTTRVSGLLFFEASTRTRIGFEVASWKLGIKSVVMGDTKFTEAMSQAESIKDTIRTLNPYVTFYCIRHSDESIFEEVVPFTDHPVINCGNGYQEHPTQALIDAYTMWNKFGKLDGLNITIIGQLKYSRAVHSLLVLLSNFSNVSINEVCPTELQATAEYKEPFEVSGNAFRRTENHVWGGEQVVYSTGFPPKNPSGTFSKDIRDKYIITKALAETLSADCIILNALPRIDEIDAAVDDLPNAYYFKQNELGLYVRMAVIEKFCL